MDEQPPSPRDEEKTEISLPPASTQQPANVEKEMTGFERATLLWAKVAVLMSGLAAIFVCAQWYEMHHGGQDTHALAVAAKAEASKMSAVSDAADKIRQAAQDMVVQDRRIADNAQESLETSNRQAQAALDATIKNFQRDQRAWLGAADYTYSIVETGPISSSAIVFNTGKSPAIDIRCRITGITKLKGENVRDSDIIYPSGLTVVKEGTIFPNQHFPLYAGGPPMDPEKQKIWFENVQGGAWIQYFFGEVRYQDISGNDHWTHFCTEFVPATKSGAPCAVYNDTDDTKKR
jgi:hypothetical protein